LNIDIHFLKLGDPNEQNKKEPVSGKCKMKNAECKMKKAI